MKGEGRVVWVVVPFREQHEFDRRAHLDKLLHTMHAHMRARMHECGKGAPTGVTSVHVVVVEQLDHERTKVARKFNRGKLLNAGFHELWHNPERAFARAGRPGDVFIAHDVDLVPNRELFACYGEASHGRAIHLARPWDRYATGDGRYVGGILAMTCGDMQRANGYSTMYWGWGGEDDDFRVRMAACDIRVDPPRASGGRVEDLEGMGLREKLDLLRASGAKCANKWELRQHSSQRRTSDGLSSLRYCVCATVKRQFGGGVPLTCTTLRVLL